MRPAAHLPFFFAKKVGQKGDPAARDPLRGRPVFGAFGRGPRKLSSLKQRAALIRPKAPKTGTGRKGEERRGEVGCRLIQGMPVLQPVFLAVTWVYPLLSGDLSPQAGALFQPPDVAPTAGLDQ